MTNLTRKIIFGIDVLNDRTGKLISFLMPLLILFETYEVASRYLLGRPTIWISELSAMIFGAFIMLGGGYTLYHGAHANMDILYSSLPKRGRAFLNIITFFCFTTFIGVLLWQGGQMAWQSLITLEHDSTEWAPPIYYFKMTLPLGALLLLLQGLSKFLKDLIILVKGDF